MDFGLQSLKFGIRTEHLLDFAFFMDDLLPTAEGDVPALRNRLGFGPWWGQSGGHRWKWEFWPGREGNGSSSGALATPKHFHKIIS